MSGAGARVPADRRTARERLYLLFRIAGDRYAIDARQVVEVLPLLPLKRIPEAPAWVAGLVSRRGRLIPVLDLILRATGRPAATLTSSRLVLVDLELPGEAQTRRLGLILEQATDTLRCVPEAFRDPGLEAATASYLGPVLETSGGLVQRVEVDQLVPAELISLLFAAEGAA